MMEAVFKQFEEHSPVSLMARATFEYTMAAKNIDESLRRYAVRQYEDELLFSTGVERLGLAVRRARNSVNEA